MLLSRIQEGNTATFQKDKDKYPEIARAWESGRLIVINASNNGESIRVRAKKPNNVGKTKNKNSMSGRLNAVRVDVKKQLKQKKGRKVTTNDPKKLWSVARYIRKKGRTPEADGLTPKQRQTPDGRSLLSVLVRVNSDSEYDVGDELYDDVVEEELVDDGSLLLRENQLEHKMNHLTKEFTDDAKNAGTMLCDDAVEGPANEEEDDEVESSDDASDDGSGGVDLCPLKSLRQPADAAVPKATPQRNVATSLAKRSACISNKGSAATTSKASSGSAPSHQQFARPPPAPAPKLTAAALQAAAQAAQAGDAAAASKRSATAAALAVGTGKTRGDKTARTSDQHGNRECEPANVEAAVIQEVCEQSGVIAFFERVRLCAAKMQGAPGLSTDLRTKVDQDAMTSCLATHKLEVDALGEDCKKVRVHARTKATSKKYKGKVENLEEVILQRLEAGGGQHVKLMRKLIGMASSQKVDAAALDRLISELVALSIQVPTSVIVKNATAMALEHAKHRNMDAFAQLLSTDSTHMSALCSAIGEERTKLVARDVTEKALLKIAPSMGRHCKSGTQLADLLMEFASTVVKNKLLPQEAHNDLALLSAALSPDSSEAGARCKAAALQKLSADGGVSETSVIAGALHIANVKTLLSPPEGATNEGPHVGKRSLSWLETRIAKMEKIENSGESAETIHEKVLTETAVGNTSA